MDVAKLLTILEDNSLFFTSITNLDDPLEGFLNRATVSIFRKLPQGLPKIKEEETKKIIEGNLLKLKQARSLLNVSSWHMNEHESAAMWQLYSRGNQGIAIQTTYMRLKESFNDAKEDVLIGKVRYIDEDNDTIDWVNVINYALHKRKSFEHEKELRAIVLSPSDDDSGGSVSVDLKKLIERIYVAPKSSQWIFELIQKIIRRYNLEIPVVQSRMFEKPLY